MNIKNSILRPVWHMIRNNIQKYKYGDLISKEIDSEKPLVLFVAHSSIKGGAPLLGLHIIKELKRNGYEVFAVVMEPGELLPRYYEECPCELCLTIKNFENILNEHAIQFAILNSALTGKFSVALKKRNITVVSLVHELPKVLVAMNGIKRTKLLLQYSDKVVFPSSIVKKEVLSFVNYKDVSDKYIIRPQGVYLMHNNPEEKKEARLSILCKYNIPLSQRVVLNVASTSSRKGFDIFVKMAKSNPNYQFVWVGVNKNSFYRTVINSIGGEVPTNFYEVGYVNDPNDLFKFYYAADVFCLTSREEPMGSVVLEAFSVGLPVFAFNGCGGFVDVIVNGETGFLADSIDDESMIRLIREFFKMTKDEQNMIKNNCISCSQKYSFESYVQFIIDCASELKHE